MKMGARDPLSLSEPRSHEENEKTARSDLSSAMGRFKDISGLEFQVSTNSGSSLYHHRTTLLTPTGLQR